MFTHAVNSCDAHFIIHSARWIYRLASITFKIQDLSSLQSFALINTFYLTNNNDATYNGINVRITCERNIVIFFVISAKNVIAHIFRNIQHELQRADVIFYFISVFSSFFFKFPRSPSIWMPDADPPV